MQDAADSFLVRHQFLIRRLHSLSGLIPVGAYLCVHLATNASVLGGTATFQANVDKIHALGPLLPFVEWTFIFIPILFHAIFGVVIIRGGLPNTSDYPYAGNIRYTLQRATGMIAFVFILVHVLQLHHMGGALNGIFGGKFFGQFQPEQATSSAAGALQASGWVLVFYALGVVASVYHLANGVWTMGITWGAWTSPAAQRRANYVCAVFGVLLMMAGLGALGGFSQVDIEQATVIEERMEHSKALLNGEVAASVSSVADDEEDDLAE